MADADASAVAVTRVPSAAASTALCAAAWWYISCVPSLNGKIETQTRSESLRGETFTPCFSSCLGTYSSLRRC